MLKTGVCGLKEARAGWNAGVQAVELGEMTVNIPRPKVLRRWRAEAPGTLAYVAAVPFALSVGDPGGPCERPFRPLDVALALWDRIMESAGILDAKVVFMTTPAAFTPSRPNRRALVRFFDRCPRKDLRVVWNPRGLWEPEDSEALCADLDLVPVSHPLSDRGRAPLGRPFVYARVDRLSFPRSGLGSEEVEILSEWCAAGQQGFCILDTSHSVEDALAIANQVQRLGAALRDDSCL